MFLLSLLSKEEGILFLFMGLVYVIVYKKSRIKRFFTVGLITLLLYGFLRIVVGGAGLNLQSAYSLAIDGKFVPIQVISLSERLLTMPQIIFYYIQIFFYPAKLAVDQLWVITKVNNWSFYIPLFIDISFFAGAVYLLFDLFHKQRKLFTVYLFFSVWFLLGLGMHLQIVPLEMTVADRWFYFFIIGLLGMFGVLLSVLGKKVKNKNILIVAGLLIVIILSIRTVIRNANWYSEISLFSHDSQIKDNYDLELNLGADYLKDGNTAEAFIHTQKSVDMYPFVTNLYNLGVIYEYTANLPKATEFYWKAFNGGRKQHNATIYLRLGWSLILSRNFSEAKRILSIGLSYYPADSDLLYELAMSEYQLGYQPEALVTAEKSVSISPTDEHNNLYINILNKQTIQLP